VVPGVKPETMLLSIDETHRQFARRRRLETPAVGKRRESVLEGDLDDGDSGPV
jgi:hypothetical protein